MFVKQDAYERIRSLPALEPRIVKPRGWAVFPVHNHKAGLVTSKPLRQALAGRAGHGADHARRLRPQGFLLDRPRAVLPRAGVAHDGRSGAPYNQRDRDKARRLAKEVEMVGDEREAEARRLLGRHARCATSVTGSCSSLERAYPSRVISVPPPPSSLLLRLPGYARSLFTVRAAISSALSSDSPRCSNCP